MRHSLILRLFSRSAKSCDSSLSVMGSKGPPSDAVRFLDEAVVLQKFKECVPKLTFDLHKGQAGRIGTVGGCKEYTGAPYYAAISSLKAGADLSHVYCLEAAANVIKSYSPELIVHPVLDHPSVEDEMAPWLQKMHALVIGPGLGRSFSLMSPVKIIIHKAIQLNIPLVIDADGVYLVSCDPDVIQGYSNCILTPNWVEFKLLYSRVFGEALNESQSLPESVAQLARRLGHVTVVLKHHRDVISDGRCVVVVSAAGSPRRCGGQGDVLAGATGTFFHWTKTEAERAEKLANGAENTEGRSGKAPDPSPSLVAAFGSCILTKRCSERSFAIHGRSTTTVDLVNNIGGAFTELFDS